MSDEYEPAPYVEPTWGMSPDISEIAAALSKAQAVMGPAIKGAINPHLKSKYADLTAVLEAVREPLAAHGLAVSQMPSASSKGVGLRTMLMHTSGQYLWSTLTVPLSKQDAQGVGSALTYARRYALSAMVGVGADDDDGSAAVRPSDRQPTRAAAPRQKKRQPPPRSATGPLTLGDVCLLMNGAETLAQLADAEATGAHLKNAEENMRNAFAAMKANLLDNLPWDEGLDEVEQAEVKAARDRMARAAKG